MEKRAFSFPFIFGKKILKYKALGNTGLQISRIAFGCMSLKPDNPDFENIIHEAIAKGINYFDTADLYDKGENEILLGKAIRSQRDKLIIASKAGNQWRADGSGWDWNPRKGYILQCAEESLRRLQTDYIDVFQLHGGTIQDNIDESIEAFEILIQQGKIRYYGLSSIRPNVIRHHVAYGRMVSVMIQYSLLDKRPEEKVLDLLQQNNIAVLTRGSLASGLLVDKPAKPYLGQSEQDVRHAQQVVEQMSDAQRSRAQTALQYVLQHPAVTSAVVGIRTTKQLQDAVKAIDLPTLNDEQLAALKQNIPATKYAEHR